MQDLYGANVVALLSGEVEKVLFRHEKEHNPKLLSPDILCWGRGLPHEGVGGQKVRYAPRNEEIKLFWRDIPEILLGYPGGVRKF